LSCNPERVTGYVDGVLDEASAAEVKAHVGTCSECREQAAFEQDLRRRLRGLSALDPALDFEQRVLKRSRRPRRPSLRWSLPAAAALVAVAILGVRTSARLLSWELVKDHIHCFGRTPLEAHVWGPDPGRVASWFGENGNTIPVPPASAGGLELVGGRRCMLLPDAVIVAHLLYEGGQRRTSVFVLPSTRPIPDSYTAEIDSESVRLLRVGTHTVGIVGDTPEDAEAFKRAFTESRAWNETPSRPFLLTMDAALASILGRPVGL
jgi:anti-sigma factor RsiW